MNRSNLEQNNHVQVRKVISNKNNNFASLYGGDSNTSIFTLPEPILDVERNTEANPFKLKKTVFSKKNSLQQPVELGQVGRLYEANLRNTMRTHTKNIFLARKRQQSLREPSLQNTLELDTLVGRQQHQDLMATLGQRGASNTLKLLQKFILKGQEGNFELKEDMRLRPHRLPLLHKQQSQREKVKPLHDTKYRWEAGLRLNRRRQVNLGINRLDRPQICGWDNNQELQDQ